MAITKSYVKYIYTILFVGFILIPIVLFYPGWNLDDTGWHLINLKYEPFKFLHEHFKVHTGDRFHPLYFVSNQLVSFISFKPLAFYIYNYLVGFLSIAILIGLCLKFFPKFWYLPIILLFTPSFNDIFYKFYGDKDMFFLWSLFLLLFFIPFSNKSTKINIQIFYSLLIANLALYMREVQFILLVGFTIPYFLWWQFSVKKYCKEINQSYYSKTIRLFFILFIISGLVFLIQYFVFADFMGQNSYYHSVTPEFNFHARFLYSAKALILYTISDPLIVLMLPILSAATHIQYRKIKINNNVLNSSFNHLPMIDSLAFASFSFFLSHVLLGVYEISYLASGYPFAIIAITGYFSILAKQGTKIFDNKLKIIISVVVIILMTNGIFSSFNRAIFYKVSSYNFMQYKDSLINKIGDINSIENKKLNFYLPGKKDIGYIADRHRDILNFYEVDIAKIEFAYNKANQNWVGQNGAGNNGSIVNKGDLLLITPNSTISKEEIMANLQGLQLHEIMSTDSPYYFELPEIRHFLKYIMLKKNTDALGSKMVYREVDYAIYEVL